LRGGLREGGGEEEIWRGERDAKREDFFFFFFSCARKENVCILGQVMRCLVYRLAQFRADLSKLRPEINKKNSQSCHEVWFAQFRAGLSDLQIHKFNLKKLRPEI